MHALRATAGAGARGDKATSGREGAERAVHSGGIWSMTVTVPPVSTFASGGVTFRISTVAVGALSRLHAVAHGEQPVSAADDGVPRAIQVNVVAPPN